MDYNNTVVILRGVSGAGKNTWIKDNIQNARICSADDYFVVKETYYFDVTKLPEAHAWCQKKFLQAIHDHISTIVVNNTNTRCWEWENYARIALISGYDVEVVSLICDTVGQIRKCCGRTQHQVPKNIIADAAVRFEDTNEFCSEDLRHRIKVTTIQV